MEMAPEMKIGEMKIKELSDILEQVEVYTNATSGYDNFIFGDDMQTMAVGIVEMEKYELILKMSELDKDITFYAKKVDDFAGFFSDLVIITTESDQKWEKKYTVIRLVGEFTVKDIQQMTKAKEK